ncbi:MAG: hypothetical protein PHN75_18780, partial [Syntrophales bacterium]|nr:hypothetical protein [Syntrophales bacterium]
HREQLKDIIRRWMYNDLSPSDAHDIRMLVHFNDLFVSRYLQLFSHKLFTTLHGEGLSTHQICMKSVLKDVIVETLPYHNDRIDELIRQYKNQPGLFFRETPCQATLYLYEEHDSRRYVGSSRIKRIRRLAEKAERRIIDGIYDAIRDHADRLAEERARQLGIPKDCLMSTDEEMLSEFMTAEEHLLDNLRLGRPVDEQRIAAVNDVAGIKVILEEKDQGRLIEILDGREDCEVLEVEKHEGIYNAVNLIVRFQPPKDEILQQPIDKQLLTIMGDSGRSPSQTFSDFAAFVNSGEASVHLEIITSSYQEMLESEIGRCMHEDRIIEQRLKQQYRGHLANNVEYLVRYLFIFPLSVRTSLDELPFKLWNRYLPDYFDAVVAELLHIRPYGALE